MQKPANRHRMYPFGLNDWDYLPLATKTACGQSSYLLLRLLKIFHLNTWDIPLRTVRISQLPDYSIIYPEILIG